MSSSYFSVELSTLTHLGSRLEEIAGTVRSGATFTAAHGAEAYGEVTSAVADYKSDWDNAVQRIETKVRGWGGITKSVGLMMHEHDQSLADSWRGKGSGS